MLATEIKAQKPTIAQLIFLFMVVAIVNGFLRAIAIKSAETAKSDSNTIESTTYAIWLFKIPGKNESRK